jgi:hypothetical protein
MKSATLGFRVHSGWTSLIAVALEKNLPIILVRQRPHLVATFSYTFRQPFHTAEKMDLAEAKTFLDQLRKESHKLALAAIHAAQTEAAQQGYELTRAALLLASGRPLPELPRILESHSIIHTADGEFFRDALLRACARADLSVTKIRERELLAMASSTLRHPPAKLTQFISDLGKPLGSPWTQDEKFATFAAWLAHIEKR